MLEKAKISVNGSLKVILAKTQKKMSGRKNFNLREYQSIHEQNIGRNMDGRGHTD